MKTIDTALHLIDHAESKVERIDISKGNLDFDQYIKELLTKINEAENKRQFAFVSDDTQVILLIQEMIKGNKYLESAGKIADRLMRKEQNAQSDISHLKHEIQKGILLQAVVEIKGIKKMVIAKADHNDYLDEQKFDKRKGLPIKKKLYKAILIEFDKKNEIKDLFVFDTHTNIARYWWDDFLELHEINTDAYNTDKAFDAIDHSLLAKLKSKHPSDHNIIRNRVLGYFKSTKTFKISKLINYALGNYIPVDENFPVEELKKKLSDLPEKKKFDSQFLIESSVIKAKKLRNIVSLNDDLDLHIKDHMKDLNEIITAEKRNGIKYIRIKTTLGYEAFKTNEE